MTSAAMKKQSRSGNEETGKKRLVYSDRLKTTLWPYRHGGV
jgi:hypothetical protein